MVVASPPVRSYADAVGAAVEATFGDRLVGVWLLGSHAYGGATESSDIDIQAAVHDAAPEEVSELADRIAHPQLWCPGAGLEFVLYEARALAEPQAPLRWLLNLNGGPDREAKVSTDPSTESWHWFVLDLAIGRDTAVTIRGRDLEEVAGQIDRHTVAEAIAASQRWHEVHDTNAPNRTANAARGLRFLRTGAWVSKPEAIAWASAQGFDRAAILEELSSTLANA